ncbi:hypothetical protein SLEP1_g18452 [Rubroshorea leprosula]|uniref:Uncharacterized protein n=1 Tax=Rubroshorea leprosula TaxID=152421 RepID=A0AAV5IXH7_9ROSI|nr:hypothetical protein SLEP1_g18452 [Rubroshorea leprosula]
MSQVEGGSFLPFLVAVVAPLFVAAVGFILLRRHKQQKQQLDLSNDEETVEDGYWILFFSSGGKFSWPFNVQQPLSIVRITA